jgi:Ni/Co efflux regulator RcnB
MSMKSFKSYISEAESSTKPPTASEKARERQDREKEEFKKRQDREMEKAREQDFRQKEAEKKQAAIQKSAEKAAKKQESLDSEDGEYVPEYLEDGTLTLVKNYKSATPKQ